jgi:hypothetical protein
MISGYRNRQLSTQSGVVLNTVHQTTNTQIVESKDAVPNINSQLGFMQLCKKGLPEPKQFSNGDLAIRRLGSIRIDCPRNKRCERMICLRLR